MMSSLLSCLFSLILLLGAVNAQQFAGDVIPNGLPAVPGSEITYFRVKDPAGMNNNLTLTNYFSLYNRARLDPTKVQRAVIIIHGLNRDPGTYMSNMLSALAQTTKDPNVNFGSVQIMAPYFPNGDDKNVGYPWTAGLKPGRGSITNALVWPGSQWSAGGNNQYPWNATTVSSYEVLDQLTQYFDDRTRYPNLKQIVVAGHSLGGQTVGRYAQVGKILNTKSPVSYWIGNPNSWAWLSTSRPLDTKSCPTYDNWREGYTNFAQYPMTYGVDLVAQGRPAILANYKAKSKIYARGTLDTGDDSSSCAPGTTGINRNERFFNFIKAFPPTCASPAGQCDIVDYVRVGHDGGAMMASDAGQARLFLDNFYGDGKRAYDFGYPRKQAGDDPYPDPAANATMPGSDVVYAGNMTYQGCWSDNTRGMRSLAKQPYADTASNSIDQCTAACATAGYTVAGVEFGVQCYCGSQLGPYATQTVDAGCGMACPGNSSQICGDGNRLSVFSSGVPSQAALPGTPENIGNYTSTFCYTEASSGRALSAKSYTDGSNMTLESCAAFCNGYQYFGIEFASECYCGSYFSSGSVVAANSDCSMTCSGNAQQYCGGGNRLTVYTLQAGAPITTITQNAPPATSSAATSASTVVSTSSAAPVPFASMCPTADSKTLVSSSGKAYVIKCSSDSTIGAYGNGGATTSYLDCMDVCDAQTTCNSFVYVGGTNGLGSGTCWLKNDIGNASPAGSNFIFGARTAAATTSDGQSASTTSVVTQATSAAPIISLSCPASNGTTYTSSTGALFVVECGIDHLGGDLAAQTVSSFAGCVEDCAAKVGCVDVSLSGTACYMKSSLGAAVSNGGILGARLFVPQTTTSTTSTTSSTTMTVPLSPVMQVPSTTTTILLTTTSDATTTSGVATTSAVSLTSATTESGTTSSTITVSSSSLPVSVGGNTLTTTSDGSSATSLMSSSTTSADTSSLGSTNILAPSSSFTSVSTLTSPASSTTSTESTMLASTSSLLASTTTGTSLDATTTLASSTTTSTSSSVASATAVTMTASSVSASDGTSSTTTGSSSSTSVPLPSVTASSPSITSSTASTVTRSSFVSPSSSAASTTTSTAETTSSATATTTATTTATATVSTSPSTTAITAASTSSSLASTSITTSSSPIPSPTTMTTTTRSSTTLSSTTTTTVALPADFTPVGCYVDSAGSRALPSAMYSNSTNTPVQCALFCRSRSFRYSGTEYGSECYCGNTLPSTATTTGCTSRCAGDKMQQCGGNSRISIVGDSAWAPTFFVRQAYRSWAVDGCYAEAGVKRTLSTALTPLFGGGKNMTVANCLDTCAAKGLKYCGVEYYHECFGSKVAPQPELAIGGHPLTVGCNYACAGNSSEACGGSNRLIIYVDGS